LVPVALELFLLIGLDEVSGAERRQAFHVLRLSEPLQFGGTLRRACGPSDSA
jgi:hypothetical protein